MKEKEKKKIVETLLSRSIPQNGRKAIAGWIVCAYEADDLDTIDDMARACNCDPNDWQTVIASLAPVWEDLLAQWRRNTETQEIFQLYNKGAMVGILVVIPGGPSGRLEWPGQFSIVRCTADEEFEFNAISPVLSGDKEIMINLDDPANWQDVVQDYLATLPEWQRDKPQ